MIFLKRFAKYSSVRPDLTGLWHFNEFAYGFTKHEYVIERDKFRIFTFYYVGWVLQRSINISVMPNIYLII